MNTEKIDVLDHGLGYVKFIESWGSDQAIVEAARMSTDKGFLGWDAQQCPVCDGVAKVERQVKVWDGVRGMVLTDEKTEVLHGRPSYETRLVDCLACEGKGEIRGDAALLRYLYEKRHSTPFEFAGMTIEIQAPIMVFREWHRHRTQSYSELSARYTPLPDNNYMPTPARCLLVGGANKQAGKAKGAKELTHENVLAWLERLARVYDHAEMVYQDGLELGIPKELARLPVPVGRYSRMRATGNLRNWLMFLTLRRDQAAQWEIRQYATTFGDRIVAELFARTWDIYLNPRSAQ